MKIMPTFPVTHFAHRLLRAAVILVWRGYTRRNISDILPADCSLQRRNNPLMDIPFLPTFLPMGLDNLNVHH
jgi:hypothetical protein